MGYKHLTLERRYEIKAYLKCNKSQKFIAEQLGGAKVASAGNFGVINSKEEVTMQRKSKNKPTFVKRGLP